MRKYYVLDTNILLHDPNSLTSFQDNVVVIPIEVVAEIDRFKKELSDRGANARAVTRLLDNLRMVNNLADGVPINEGGLLRVHCDRELPVFNLPATPIKESTSEHGNGYEGTFHPDADTALLRVARQLAVDHPESPVVLVTKDMNLRIRADAMGLRAEDYRTDRISLEAIWSGQVEMALPESQIDVLHQQGWIDLPQGPGPPLVPNEYVCLHADNGSNKSCLARTAATCDRLLPIHDSRRGICGIRPRNKEQYFALDALLDDKIKLVTVMGKAGTGKTLLALAAALEKTIHKRKYKAVLVSRPTVPMGRDIGYLPGSIEKKMLPWMRPIADNLEFLLTSDPTLTGNKFSLKDLWNNGVVEIEALTYIRGRSLPNQYVIIDESQNLTPLEVKTIITRVGHETKIVLTGDPYQIDNPYVDSGSNGFNYLINRFKNEPLAAHVELRKGERSELAERAANLL